jgi:hypothetical protein
VEAQHEPFSWKPPDLREGQEWHQKRMTNLRKAAESFPDPPNVIKEGIAVLDIHQKNYTLEGPKAKQKLQLLWWEFPSEHWKPLREGSRMNFVGSPEAFIHDNAVMNDIRTKVAADFLNELLDLEAPRLYVLAASSFILSSRFEIDNENKKSSTFSNT